MPEVGTVTWNSTVFFCPDSMVMLFLANPGFQLVTSFSFLSLITMVSWVFPVFSMDTMNSIRSSGEPIWLDFETLRSTP